MSKVTDKSTTVWVPITRLCPHPANANRMSKEMRAKLRKNIEGTGYYPPIIVRSLEVSTAFQAEHAQGLLQIVDGEHRWLDCKDEHHDEVEVRVWTGISDSKAKQLLLTLNRIHGEDDRKKRAQLLRDLAEVEGDPSILAQILPEDEATISKMLQEGARVAIEDARERATKLSQNEPVTFFMQRDHADSLRKAIALWLRENDPQEQITECREGVALDGVARHYLEE